MADNTRPSRHFHLRSLRKAILPAVVVLTSGAIAAFTVAATAQSSSEDSHARAAQLSQPPVAVRPLLGPTLTLPTLVGGEVHGSIYAVIRDQAMSPFAPMLPDISVYLENVDTSAKSPMVLTDLNGTFSIPSQPEGVYHLCWQATGFFSGCKADKITLRSSNVYWPPVGILAEPGTMHGSVTLADGSACRVIAGYLNADIDATVTASLGGGMTRSVRVNNFKEYVLAGLPTGAISTTAHCEKLATAATVTLSGGTTTHNFTLPNSTPKVGGYYAQMGGITVTAAAPGSAIRATVEAKPGTGGYPVHYRWYVDPPSPGFVSPDKNTLDITTSGPGVSSIYVLVHDGYGGNAIRGLSLSARPDQILFSGHVRADNAASLADATVTINGKQTKTNGSGNFVLALPKEEPRYVATIEKVGYQLLSKTFFTPVQNGSYELFHTQQMPIAVGAPVDYKEPIQDTGKRAGAEVIIEANALAGQNGRGALATVPLVMHAASYNLRNPKNPIPGDFTGLHKDGSPARLSTFGAVDIAITDAAGNHYNLAEGKLAVVKVPIDPAMLPTAPATMPVWHFDSLAGVWNEEGEAVRVGNFYETKVTHFSAINMDLATSDGACTRIHVDQLIMPTPFKIRMTPQNGMTVRPDHQDQIVDGPLSVVVRQPPNTDIVYDMVDSNDNVIPAAEQTVHTNASSPTGQQWPVPASASPYADCTSDISYNEQTVQGLFPTNAALDFLTYKTPTSPNNLVSGPAADTFTAQYYSLIDPTGLKTQPGHGNNFDNWKQANGFNRPGETNTKYGNNYDLGFGRDMHMQTGGETGSCPSCIAYYVTNYQTVEDAVNGGTVIATVAMEYSPANGVSGTPFTKFYVFDASGNISPTANLDGNGPKNVPSLCVICHNGNVTSMGADGSLPFARFIPFDLDSFAYTANAAFPQYQRPGNETPFNALNKGVLQTNVSQPILALTTQWYGTVGDTTLAGTFNGTIVPSGWTSPPIPPPDQSTLYSTVVKPYCRTCHTTRDPNDNGRQIAWDTYDSLDSDSFFVRILACTPSSHAHAMMPNAKRTFARFWLSTQPNAPIALGNSSLQGFASPSNSCPE